MTGRKIRIFSTEMHPGLCCGGCTHTVCPALDFDCGDRQVPCAASVECVYVISITGCAEGEETRAPRREIYLGVRDATFQLHTCATARGESKVGQTASSSRSANSRLCHRSNELVLDSLSLPKIRSNRKVK